MTKEEKPKKPTSISEVGLSDLLPCPFCGSEAMFGFDILLKKSFIKCSNNCVISPHTFCHNKRKWLAQLWNQRAG